MELVRPQTEVMAITSLPFEVADAKVGKVGKDAVDELRKLGQTSVGLQVSKVVPVDALVLAAEERDELARPAELAAQALDLGVFEALDVTRRVLGVVTMLAKDWQGRRCH